MRNAWFLVGVQKHLSLSLKKKTLTGYQPDLFCHLQPIIKLLFSTRTQQVPCEHVKNKNTPNHYEHEFPPNPSFPAAQWLGRCLGRPLPRRGAKTVGGKTPGGSACGTPKATASSSGAVSRGCLALPCHRAVVTPRSKILHLATHVTQKVMQLTCP